LLKPLIISGACGTDTRNPIKHMIIPLLVSKLTVSELTPLAGVISTCPGCREIFPQEASGEEVEHESYEATTVATHFKNGDCQ
jgi:hypothetical protein